MPSSLFDTGIRPTVDAHLLKLAEEKRDYGDYWSASSAGYCMRRNIFERLKILHVTEDARKQRVFTAGDIFHEWMQRITKEAGLSIAQELELQDEDLMIRGHIDDLVLVEKPSSNIRPDVVAGQKDGYYETKVRPQEINLLDNSHLILYDYKSQNSRAFTYQKGKPMSYYHKMQLGTYMYMLRTGWSNLNLWDIGDNDLYEARILKISKDDLRMSEDQLLWSLELEQEVTSYWKTLNRCWKEKSMPSCTCADHENGFLAKEAYNPFYYDGEPCSIKLYNKWKKEQE